MSTRCALRLRGISKRFPGVQALKDVDFECNVGEIHALVGENGSGKSTLVKIASGDVRPETGAIEIHGEPLKVGDPRVARRMGLGTVYQDNSLVLELTAAQNLYLSAPDNERPKYAQMATWAAKCLKEHGLEISPHALVSDLSLAMRQLLEVVKVLISRRTVLLFDEPTTALDAKEVEQLHEFIRKLAASGVSIVYVSHRLPEVLSLADRVTILRDGVSEGTYPTAELSEERIVSLMVGIPLGLEFPSKVRRGEEPEVVLHAKTLVGPRFGPIDLEAHRGEILGLAGAEGNGQRDMMRALAGVERAAGHVTCNGHKVPLHSVRKALQLGIMMLSGDRVRESVFPALGVRQNMGIQVLSDFSTWGVLVGNGERVATGALVETLDIATPSLDQPVRLLSGGNQQKAALGRAFLYPASVLLVDEPTQGVDVKSRLDIYRSLRAKASEGIAVIVNSADAHELAGLCDRVLVVSRGRVVRELQGDELTEENIVSAFARSSTDAARRPLAVARATLSHRWLDLAPRLFTAEWAPMLVLAILMIVLGGYTTSQSTYFLTRLNMSHLMLMTLPLALVAMAQLNALLVGGFDLSVGSQVSLTVVFSSFALASDKPTPALFGGILAALCVGLLVGGLNATLVRGIRITPVIATIATLGVIQGIALLLRPVPEGLINRNFMEGITKQIGFVPWMFVFVVVLAIFADFWLHRTAGGLSTRAVGYREEAARRIGIPTTMTHVRAYLLSGLLAALAGLFLASQVGVGDPRSGVHYGLTSIAAAVLGGASLFGGRGSFVGAVLGALFLSLVVNVIPFLEINSAFGLIATGVLTLLAIIAYSAASSRSRSVGDARPAAAVA